MKTGKNVDALFSNIGLVPLGTEIIFPFSNQKGLK